MSGFLITAILLSGKAGGVDNRAALKTFYIKRSLRIFPVYYATIIVLFLLNYASVRHDFLWLLTYTSNIQVYAHQSWNEFSHSWSLAVEEQFYFIWPWLILFTPAKLLKHLFLFFLLIGMVSSFWILREQHSLEAVLPFNCFDAFGIGGAYAYASTDKTRLMHFRKMLRLAFPVAVIVYFFWKLAPYGGYMPRLNFWSRTIDSVIAIWIIDAVIRCKDGRVKRNLLENKWLTSIGTFSYGIYLFHYPIDFMYDQWIIRLLHKYPALPAFLNNFYFAYCIKLIVLFTLSYLSFHYFEKRFLALKKRLAYTSQGQFINI